MKEESINQTLKQPKILTKLFIAMHVNIRDIFLCMHSFVHAGLIFRIVNICFILETTCVVKRERMVLLLPIW